MEKAYDPHAIQHRAYWDLVGACSGPNDAAPLTISPNTSVHEAYRLIQDQRIGHPPVCEDERLAGLISELGLRLVLPSPATSLAAHELYDLLEWLTVAEIMTRTPVMIDSDHAVTEAARRMLAHKMDTSAFRLDTVGSGTASGRLKSEWP